MVGYYIVIRGRNSNAQILAFVPLERLGCASGKDLGLKKLCDTIFNEHLSRAIA